MLFENYTSFPAIGWLSWDNKAKEYNSVVVRVKYLFKEMDEDGVWSLKLAPKQGELFATDIFYEDNMSASVLFESDYIAYKPHADLVVNGFSYSSEERESWYCGVEALRPMADRFETLVKLRDKFNKNWKVSAGTSVDYDIAVDMKAGRGAFVDIVRVGTAMFE